MRIIADENVHRKVVAGLRSDGHDVLWVAELRPSIDDREVLEWARSERSLLLTSDRDFGKILVSEGDGAPEGVIYLRLPLRSVGEILDRLRDLLKGERNLSDHLVVVAPAGDRWRPLSSMRQENGRD